MIQKKALLQLVKGLVICCLFASIGIAGGLVAEDIAFVGPNTNAGAAKRKKNKKKKKKKKTPDAPEAQSPKADFLWICLTPTQVKNLQRKTRVQKKMERRDENRESQMFPIELTKEQKLAVRKTLKIKSPLPRKVFLYTDFNSLRQRNDKSGWKFNNKCFYILRPTAQFSSKTPSDANPNSRQ